MPRKVFPLFPAAGFPLASEAAWTALFEVGGLKQGQSVLIHGGSGGVGSFAIQLAKIAGAGRMVTTTSGRNSAMVKSLGADEVIDYTKEDFSEKLHDLDLVFDTLGGETPAKSLRCSGKEVPLFHRSVLTKKQHQLTGFWGNLSCSIQTERWCREIAELIDLGKLKVVIEKNPHSARRKPHRT